MNKQDVLKIIANRIIEVDRLKNNPIFIKKCQDPVTRDYSIDFINRVLNEIAKEINLLK